MWCPVLYHVTHSYFWGRHASRKILCHAQVKAARFFFLLKNSARNFFLTRNICSIFFWGFAQPPPPHQKSNGPPLTLRDEADLLFCFLICLVKFPAREGNSRRRRVSSNPGNWVCVFFSFFPLLTVLASFSRSNAHTHTNKEAAKTREKAERRQRAVRSTRFLDYISMFDSGCSLSLKYDLIRPPY